MWKESKRVIIQSAVLCFTNVMYDCLRPSSLAQDFLMFNLAAPHIMFF